MKKLMLFGATHPVPFTIFCCAVAPVIVVVGIFAGVDQMLNQKPFRY